MEINSIFQRYAENREKLLKIFEDANGVFTDLGVKSELEQMNKSLETLNRDTFKILVVGEFKRGKSTFINALLGEEVLPAFATPCTAVINEIKYSEEKKAVLHFSNPLPSSLPKLSPDVEKHIAQHRSEDHIPPMEIPIDRIEEFVVIPDPGKDQAESISESPFSLVEIFWPIDLCKNRVEIIDSPGLNEHGTRTKITTDYLTQVDAVIFVLSCSALASQSELSVISDSIMASGHEEIFFVCNRFDEIREKDRPRIIDYAKKKLGDKTTLENGIHFLSALKALDAKIDNNESALEQSGFSDLEKNLVSFLVNDRGRLKLMRPASALKRQIRSLIRETIPMQKGMLAADLNDLQKRFEDERPKLEDAEKRRVLIREKISGKCVRIKDYVRREINSFITSTAFEVPDMIKSYKTDNTITFLSLDNTKRQCAELTKELLAKLETDIAKKQREWAQNVLQPEIQGRIQDMYDNTTVDLEQFLSSLDSIKAALSTTDVNENQRDVPAWERIAAAGVGLIFLSEGSVIQAGQDGFKGLLKSILPQLGVAIAMGILGLTNPWIFIPVLLGTGGISAFLSNSKLEGMLRAKLGDKVKEALISSAGTNAEKATEELSKNLDGIVNQVDDGMKHEIEIIQENVNKILQVKKEGEEKARAKEQLLITQQKKAEGLVDSIEELTESF